MFNEMCVSCFRQNSFYESEMKIKWCDEIGSQIEIELRVKEK